MWLTLRVQPSSEERTQFAVAVMGGWHPKATPSSYWQRTDFGPLSPSPQVIKVDLIDFCLFLSQSVGGWESLQG